MATKIEVFLCAGVLFFLTVPLLSPALGKALTSQECGVLRAQKQDMEAKGLGETISKGADWAFVNLDAGQIKEVGTFLELTEEIRFRCGTSDVRAKGKKSLYGNVPLPVRNSRRLKNNAAVKNTVATVPAKGPGPGPGAAPDPAITDGMASETKAVVTAITSGDEGAAKDGEQSGVQPSSSARPKMRKSLGK